MTLCTENFVLLKHWINGAICLLLLLAFSVNVQAGTKEELLFAIKSGKLNEVSLLLSNGSGFKARGINFEPKSSPNSALPESREDIDEFLIAKGDDVNEMCNHGITPLHLAASEGRKDIAELLISKGSSISDRTRSGNTPLHFAAAEGRMEVAELLIAQGAEINVKNKYGIAPLHIANRRGHKELASLLITKGADVSAIKLEKHTSSAHPATNR